MKNIKKVLSLLLLIAIFLSMIYIPASAASITLPDGTEMKSGESSSSNSGFTAISTADQFKRITTGGKYYLTANIDLTASGVNFTTLAGGANSATNIILDGCGYTITTNKPLFEELPGNSGTDGSHSQFRNLVIKGNISVSYSEIDAYSNGYSVGALAGKANGGKFTNVVNMANITVTDTSAVKIRVGGLVGSVFNDDVNFTNCLNTGTIKANNGDGSSTYGMMGGIVGYIANSAYTTTLKYCKNTGTVTNSSTATANTYAGGIFGGKRDGGNIKITNCSNYGSISSSSSYGEGVYQGLYATSSFDGITLDATPISTADDFKKIVAGGKYYLISNIDLSAPGVNFTPLAGGANSDDIICIDGLGYTVTTSKPLIAQLPGSGKVGIHSDIRNLTINGNIEVFSEEITGYANGMSAGALVGKANGGIFTNVTNNANITLTDTANANVRIGGIIGSSFNDSLTLKNCVNNGNLKGMVGNADAKYGIGGIIGFVADTSSGVATEFTNCSNSGNVNNTSSATSNVYSGAIFGTKRDECTITMKNCANSGQISSNVYFGKDVFQALYAKNAFTNVTTDVTAISTAEQFKAIVAGKKYYLTANIDLTASGVNFTTLAGGSNTASVIVLDGCGHTVTTNKPLFKEIPGGGAGKHSEITDLNIKGNIAVTLSDASTYTYMVGALACKTYGGIFKNITNNATITVSGQAGWLVGGLFGGIFYDTASLENCSNKGAISADVITDNGTHAVAGIVGHVGFSGVSFSNCTNSAKVTNTSTNAEGAYAGGIIGTKADASTTVIMRDCSNKSTVRAKTAYGNYYAISTYQNVDLIKVIEVSNAEEFAKISGNREYKLTANITLKESNTNEFSGVLYGNGFTVTSKDIIFKNNKGAKLDNVNVNIISLNINGRPLDSFAVVASLATDASAQTIVDFVKSKYSIELEVKTPSDNYVGNAIYINLGNTYGGYRYGLDYGVNDAGYMEVYLDETSANISTYVSDFLNNKLTTTKESYDFFNGFGSKSFRYEFAEGVSQGYTFNESEDVVRTLMDGVTYIQRTYTTSSGTKVKAYMVVMKADAAAHVEVAAIPLTKVSSCENDNSDNCLNLHGLNPLSTSDFVAEMEEDGKNVLAAMNAGFFMKSAGCYAPWGLQVVDGRVDAEPRNNNDSVKKYTNWFGITKDGKPVIGGLSDYQNTYKGNLLYGVGSDYLSIKNGAYVRTTTTSYDARTAVGYNADGDIVFVVVPGNDKDASNPGATRTDVSQIFMDLDMDIVNALKLDCGGSTTMVVEAANGAPKLESPLYSTTEERPLGNILAIVSDKK